MEDRTPRRERPIQLFGAGTWEALVLAEALVSAPDRFTVLDEPGASLHPTWQTALRQALRHVPGHVLLVTHTPISYRWSKPTIWHVCFGSAMTAAVPVADACLERAMQQVSPR